MLESNVVASEARKALIKSDRESQINNGIKGR